MKTAIIFDWDDTLLASSFLSSNGFRLDTEINSDEVETQLKELDASVCAVLQIALKFGQVFVITNAEAGWVQLSSQKFLPSIVPLLQKVSIVSARSSFETLYPEAPLKWKFFAFKEKLSLVFGENHKFHISNRTVISFGDSHVEREAVRAVTRGFSNIRTKSVKFADRPTMEQLRRQIDLVTNCFSYIYHHEGDLDLQLTLTSTSPPASPPATTHKMHTSSSDHVHQHPIKCNN